MKKDKIASLIRLEEERQRTTLMMIPSENYTYPEVRAAVGSVLMHKYSEGLPFKRYYQGNKVVDEIENICKSKALEAFGLDKGKWGVNVQAHSGTPANLAVYNALLEPGEKILSMYLPDGGHLSHGWHLPEKNVTLVSKVWQVDFYHLDSETKILNYDGISEKAKSKKPKLIISGGTAYTREINHKKMGQIAKDVGAYYLADVSHEAGLIAGGVNKSPFPYADIVTMTTHKTLRGPRGAIIFSKSELSEKIDKSVFPGLQGGPHNHSIAGIAIALEKTKSKEFKDYARQTVVNAKGLAQKLEEKGFDIVGGGTDKHSILIDLRNKKVNGWFAALALEVAGIIVNRNAVPNDTSFPYYPCGIRLGTQALSARGMKEKEMDMIARWVNEVVSHLGEQIIAGDKDKRAKQLKRFKTEIFRDRILLDISKEINNLCKRYPIP